MSAERARLRGILLLQSGRPQPAIDAFCESLSFEPNDANSHAWLALALLAARRVESARIEAELAVGQGPEQRLPLLALAMVLKAARRWQEAEALFLKLLALHPDAPDVHRALAELHLDRGDRARARAALVQAQALDPASPDTLAALADLCLAERKLPEAEGLARAALAEDAEHHDAIVVMGHLLLARGDLEGAREHALSVLRRDPDHRGAILLLVAGKARSSWVLGLWWRYHTWLMGFGQRAWIVLLIAFAAQRVATLGAADLGAPGLSLFISFAWLLIVVYTWVGPGLFRRAFEAELKPVALRKDF